MIQNVSRWKTLFEVLRLFKAPVILIAGGKDNEELDYEQFAPEIIDHARVLVLVGESKENEQISR